MSLSMESLGLDTAACKHRLLLSFGSETYCVHGQNKQLMHHLGDYFKANVADKVTAKHNVYLFSSPSLNLDIGWKDWPREAGKTGLKEQIFDTPSGRWIHKFKTGMLFHQSLTHPFAVGPCEQHASQIVNFILNQHINVLQRQGGLICHAACLQFRGQGIAIGAFSGGGKSTTLLRLMDEVHSQFVSNDRLFLFTEGKDIVARGIAKQPRVNPGTLYHNAKLRHLLSSTRQQDIARMKPAGLWTLEEKYDVMVEDIYGDDSSLAETSLQHVLLLNWLPQGNTPVQVRSVSLSARPELVAAIAKSPGPFYQDSSGAFLSSADIPATTRYIDMLTNVNVWEVSGSADFDQLAHKVKEVVGS